MRKATLNLYKNGKLRRRYEDINIISDKDRHSLIIDDVKTIISKDNITRENNEYRFDINIKERKATYLLKDKNTLFDIEVEDLNFDKNNTRTIVEYKISSDDEKTKIELITNGE